MGNYNTSVRRLSALGLDGVGDVQPFDQYGEGPFRWYQFEVAGSAGGTPNNIIAAGAATSWTAVPCNTCIPPTGVMGIFDMYAGGNFHLFMRKRSVGSNTVSRGLLMYGPAFTPAGLCALDAAQYAEYAASDGGASVNIAVVGFGEKL